MEFHSQENLNTWTQTSIHIALQAGEILIKYWGNLKNIKEKNYSSDLVTEADEESEKLIISQLRKFFPYHHIIAEESGQSEEISDYSWYIDPLDGTTNYSHQYPLVAISMALTYKNEPLIGIVYNPIQKELYHASRGQGAFLNDYRLKVSDIKSLDKSLLATGFPYNRRETKDNNYKEFGRLTDLTQGVRRGGSAALDLAYVAAGRLDGYWEKGIKPWDIAAGILLVKEAGGVVSDYDLNPLDLLSGKILATNGHLQNSISEELLK